MFLEGIVYYFFGLFCVMIFISFVWKVGDCMGICIGFFRLVLIFLGSIVKGDRCYNFVRKYCRGLFFEGYMLGCMGVVLRRFERCKI